jgi:hypothetical protein
MACSLYTGILRTKSILCKLSQKNNTVKSDVFTQELHFFVYQKIFSLQGPHLYVVTVLSSHVAHSRTGTETYKAPLQTNYDKLFF